VPQPELHAGPKEHSGQNSGLVSRQDSGLHLGLGSVPYPEPRSGSHLKERSEQNSMVRSGLALEGGPVLHLSLCSVPHPELHAGLKDRLEQNSMVHAGPASEVDSVLQLGLCSVSCSELGSIPHLKEHRRRNSVVR
jgi:hypothetical protein